MKHDEKERNTGSDVITLRRGGGVTNFSLEDDRSEKSRISNLTGGEDTNFFHPCSSKITCCY